MSAALRAFERWWADEDIDEMTEQECFVAGRAFAAGYEAATVDLNTFLETFVQGIGGGGSDA